MASYDNEKFIKFFIQNIEDNFNQLNFDKIINIFLNSFLII